MKDIQPTTLPTEEFMRLHDELRESSERVISVTSDHKKELKVEAFRASENQEVGK